MSISETSMTQLKEMSLTYLSRIEILKAELEDCQRKYSVIEEEISKRQKLEELRRRIEVNSKEKIEKILATDTKSKKKSEPKKQEEESPDLRKEQEKKWTIDEMKKILDKKGVKYGSTLKKSDFVALIREHNGVREMNALHKI